MKRSVLLGFSGGIDSVATALKLRDEGYEVYLLTLDTTGDPQLIESAKRSAHKIGFPLHILSVQTDFRNEIIHYFTESYLHGETPAPCTRCNVAIKWKTLYQMAQERQIDHIATGHYFRIHHEAGHYYVRRAIDPNKDQSYYLWGVPEHYLSRAITPMGEEIKQEVKGRYGTLVQARESMGVCFLGGKSYGNFLREEGCKIVPGAIVNRQGATIGQHEGCALYTIGQKRGFTCEEPGAVITNIDAVNNRLIVGSDSELYYSHLTLRDCYTPHPERLFDSSDIQVKIRGIGRNPQGYARVIPKENGVSVTLEEAAWAPANGQPVVFYQGDLVLGGGFLVDYR